MSDSDRKNVLLAQHNRISSLTSMVRGAAGAVLAVDDPVPVAHMEALERSIAMLAAAMEAHLDNEETLLRPLLWRMGAWGRYRFDLLRAEHVQQRATLSALRSEQCGIETYRRARKAASVAEEIARDMVVEERDLFATIFGEPASSAISR